jgi:hypothetical protein
VCRGPRGPGLRLVHDSAKAVTGYNTFVVRPATTLGLIAVIAFAAGCGGDSSSEPQVDAGPNVGQPINLADCDDWQQANTEQRLGTIEQLKGFAGGPIIGNNASSPSGTGPVLDDKRAYDLFEGWCSQSYARGFKLYKLYLRAAAFTGQPAQ